MNDTTVKLTRSLAIELFNKDVVEEVEARYQSNGGRGKDFWRTVNDRTKVLDHLMTVHTRHFGRSYFTVIMAIAHLQQRHVL